MDLVRTVILYMMMLVGTATNVSPSVTPMPASALPTPTPLVELITPAPTTPPTARPQATRYTTLYVGDKGTAVRNLQNRLRELGYLQGNADGSYGAQTKAAVERFQRANGLKADGIAGKATQQVMYESPDVVYANATTPTPTPRPVTATPVAPAVVTVRYVDSSTGALLRSTTAQCFANTYIYADASMVPASYRLISNSYVSIQVRNSQATPSTVTFYYQPYVTATPSAGISIPVYYLDSTNLIIARETRVLYQSGAVAADTSLIPAGYSLSGSSVVYVTLSNGTASPNPILFRLSRSQVTPTPTPVAGIVVPVRYINQVTGQAFATQSVTLYRSANIFPQSSVVPAGYTLVGNSYVTVTLSNGRANPSTVNFYYQPYQPTATPKVTVSVPVRYLYGTRLIASHTVTLTAGTSAYVYADQSVYGTNYTVSGANSVRVTVSDRGIASPAVVSFSVVPRATATPTSVPVYTVTVPVRYQYGTRLIATQNVSIQTGTTATVYADAGAYGSNYVLSGAAYARVTVSRTGVATPSTVVFNVVPRATEVPVISVPVTVRYMEGNRLVASQQVNCLSGQTTTVYADASVYAGSYTIQGSNRVNVTVDYSGKATPSIVTFNLVRVQTATPVPVTDVTIQVRYMNGNKLVAGYQEVIPANATTPVYADPSVYQGQYTLVGDDYVNVRVDARGNANPSTVIFNLTPVVTEPPVTPQPGFEVPVTVDYRNGSELIASTTVYLMSGTSSAVKADPSLYSPQYVLDGSDRVTVDVSADGYVNPNPVTFYLSPAPPITAPPTAVPPSGNINQTLPKYKSGRFSANYDVYQGPGTNYLRNGKATLGKGGMCRVYGTDGEWLLVGYEASGGSYRIGYIHNYKLPSGISASDLQELSYAWIPTTVTERVSVTDDPIINMKTLNHLNKGTEVTFLAWISSERRWAMIEYTNSKGQPVRAFVKGQYLACMK